MLASAGRRPMAAQAVAQAGHHVLSFRRKGAHAALIQTLFALATHYLLDSSALPLPALVEWRMHNNVGFETKNGMA
eukprot:5849479-Amphidinium_carterae.1